MRRFVLLLALVVVGADWGVALRSAMAREVLRSKPSQCLRLGGRVRVAEIRLNVNPGGPRAQKHFDKLARKYATRCVHLNEIQVLGSHNSYHIRPLEPLWSALLDYLPIFYQIDYTHLPLDQQFDTQGVRQIELDVWADPAGGLYANRPVMQRVNLPTASGIPALDDPGFKILHIADVDFQSTCFTFVECLTTIKAWSDAHPGHLPIAILVEAKDDATPDVFGLGFVTPVPLDTAQFDALDAEIRSVFPPERLITPDDVRRDFPTLEDAVLQYGWPTLGEARGKVMFMLDNGGHYRTDYLAGHPSLQGRVLFTSANPGNPDAAFIKLNNSKGDPIAERVAAGYVVRTRADADTEEARDNDTSTRDAALASGAQWVSTDYPVPNPEFGTPYFVEIPDGHPARCNPINAPYGCRSTALE
jgi:hypothetical protein